MSFMFAFGWASVMLLLGVALRGAIPALRNILVPASVIGGIIGFIFMNVAIAANIDVGTDTDMFTDVVSNLFTVSFISIGLTRTPKGEGNTAKNTLRGTWGMGVIWSFLYALTPLIGIGIVLVIGGFFDMDVMYGTLVQFAFCQGPGQSATYGAIYESYGWDNATTVAIAFSAVGFIAAFLVGVPMARRGLRKGLARHAGEIDAAVLRGFSKAEEQTSAETKNTTHASNIETLAFHFALIGLCYVIAVGIAAIFSLLPGFLGTSFSAMMFFNGMLAAYLVRFIMTKLKLDYLLDNTLQTKITGWTADYLVVCAFMSVPISLISEWIVPMLVVAIVICIVTYAVSMYFGRRYGGPNDFERTLGTYGMCTGTVPSGVALVRIVDPNFRTSTSVELGACNVVMMLSTPVYIILLAYASGTMGLLPVVGGLALCCVVYLILLKVFRCWGKPTFSWKDGSRVDFSDEAGESEAAADAPAEAANGAAGDGAAGEPAGETAAE